MFATMLLAWSVTETIRYPFYFLALLGIDVYALNWLRYTLFLVLYPLGAGSEAGLSFSTLPPLNTLPYIPKVLEYAHELAHKLPSNVLHSGVGRGLVWQIARARAAQHAGARWTLIEVVRLVLFFVWWPGESSLLQLPKSMKSTTDKRIYSSLRPLHLHAEAEEKVLREAAEPQGQDGVNPLLMSGINANWYAMAAWTMTMTYPGLVALHASGAGWKKTVCTHLATDGLWTRGKAS